MLQAETHVSGLTCMKAAVAKPTTETRGWWSDVRMVRRDNRKT